MEDQKRVLLVTQEMDPYLNLSSISNITSQLPKYLSDQGMEIRILMPRFGNINERRYRLHEVVRLSGINIMIDEDDYPLIIKVASLPGVRLQVYFLDNEDFFKRKSVFTDDSDTFFDDNTERMIFFCKGVLETVKKFGWPPDIIHCHGWMTSLIPLYLKSTYKDDPVFAQTKSIYSVYENTFKGKPMNNILDKEPVQIDDSNYELSFFEKGDNTGLNLGGSEFADALILGSEKVDKKIQTEILSKNGKPMLPFKDGDDKFDGYSEFYQNLLSIEAS
ncbi:MAG: glycogen/starch synthase [Chitinophagales bacterium]|nr:glycogen/starch synthase [Chitinophagales bacterium]